MSSPTELLAITGKSPTPAQVKVKSDTEGGEKSGDFIDTYEEGAQKPVLAAETKNVVAEEPEFPGESVEIEVNIDGADEAILQQVGTSETIEAAPQKSVPIVVAPEKTVADEAPVLPVEIAEVKAGSATDLEPEIPDMPEGASDAETVVAAKKADETKTTLESTVENLSPLTEDADVENAIPEGKQQVDGGQQAGVPEAPKLVALPENVVLAQNSPKSKNEPTVERVELLKPIPAETRTAQPIPVNSLQVAAKSRSELLPRETEKLVERAIKQEPDVKEVRVPEVTTRQTPQVTITAPAQQIQPTWIAALQVEQPRENLTSFSAVALEELSGYQQQARFEPVSSYQRYDAPIQTARQVTQQVAYAVAQNGSGTTEIKLSPEELGRVRMTVQAVEGMINVTVLAERQETGDLMRRNSEMLTEDLRDLGFESINLTFGNEQSDPQTNEDEASATAEFSEHTPISENGQTVIVSRTLSQGLDLRM